MKEKDEKSILKLASKIKGKKSSIAEELEKIDLLQNSVKDGKV